MKLLITGGCGFIGSNIAKYLLEHTNYLYIQILDNLSTGKLKNIEKLLEKYPERIDYMYGDITNLDTCRKAVQKVDSVCHQAALGSVPKSLDEPLLYHNSNVNGFLNILIACKENNIKRVVYASSSSVYGDNQTLPKIENKIGEVLSPYAATKMIDEIYSKLFTKCYNMEIIGLRYFNVFGPNQDPNGAYAAVIPKFIDLMKSDKSPIINGDGNFTRDFIYVENVVKANLLALNTENNNCYGEVFNIGCSEKCSILDLVNNINILMEKNIIPKFMNNTEGDIPHSIADISKAKKLLGYKPNIFFKEGLKKTIKYFLENL